MSFLMEIFAVKIYSSDTIFWCMLPRWEVQGFMAFITEGTSTITCIGARCATGLEGPTALKGVLTISAL